MWWNPIPDSVRRHFHEPKDHIRPPKVVPTKTLWDELGYTPKEAFDTATGYYDTVADIGHITGLYSLPKGQISAVKRLLKTKGKKKMARSKRKSNYSYKKKKRAKTGTSRGTYVSQGDSKKNFKVGKAARKSKRVSPTIAARVQKLEKALKKVAPNWSVLNYKKTYYWNMKNLTTNRQVVYDIPLFKDADAVSMVTTLTGGAPTNDEKTDIYNIGATVEFVNNAKQSCYLRCAVYNAKEELNSTNGRLLAVIKENLEARGLTIPDVQALGSTATYDDRPVHLDLEGANLYVDPFSVPYIGQFWGRKGRITTVKLGPGDHYVMRYFKKKFTYNLEKYNTPTAGAFNTLDDHLMVAIVGEYGFEDTSSGVETNVRSGTVASRVSCRVNLMAKTRTLDDQGSINYSYSNSPATSTYANLGAYNKPELEFNGAI